MLQGAETSHTLLMALRFFLPVLALLQQAEGLDTTAESDEINLLQVRHRTLVKSNQKHFWPHPRGRIGSLSQTPYGMPQAALNDLSAHLAWRWTHSTNLSAFVWGALIDADKNIILATMQGIYKYTAGGTQLWNNTDVFTTEMPVLLGTSIVGMEMTTAMMYSLDLETGKTQWTRKVSDTTGQEGDMVEGHNGVVIVATGAYERRPYGTPAKKAMAVNASNGAELWSFQTTCGIWNLMALFPDDESTVFMDSCGGVYRRNLFTGAPHWQHEGSEGSFTDGGNTLGPDGHVYTCSNGAHTQETANQRGTHAGRLRKINVHDGSLIWQTVLPNACFNFPGVSPDGKTVVVADSGNVLNPPMKALKGKPRAEIERAWAFQQQLLNSKSQMTYYGQDNLDASIAGFNTSTGELMWKHEVEPWYGMSWVLDEERAYLWDIGQHPFGHCGPPPWGGPTIDQNGVVYIGRSTGELHIFDPASNQDRKFHTGDGAMMAGVVFAPGLMVVPTCSWVYVFRF